MTGEYAHTRMVPGIEYRMSPAERTLADEFNDGGYETVYIGKWHLDGGHGRMGSARQVGLTPVPRTRQGRWDKWLGFELRNRPFDTFYFEDSDPIAKRIEGYQTNGLFDLGMNYLKDRQKDQPFFMVISVEPPHPPFEAPRELQTFWENREISLPSNFKPKDEAQRDMFIKEQQQYYAMVENLDDNIGRIMKFLERNGLIDDTVVVFTSDHGELGGSHGLRGKQWPYEESIGVPLLVVDPRVSEPEDIILEDPTSTEDLFPTLLGLAGLTSKCPLMGADLTPLIHGNCRSLNREGVMLEFVLELRQKFPFHQEVWRGFRTQRYKYTVRGDNLAGRPWQFFDLENDPGEQENLLENSDYGDELIWHHNLLCERLVETRDHFVLSPAFGNPGVNLQSRNQI